MQLRFVFFLRGFSATAFLVRTIVQVGKDIIHFLLIMILFILMTGFSSKFKKKKNLIFFFLKLIKKVLIKKKNINFKKKQLTWPHIRKIMLLGKNNFIFLVLMLQILFII
jgi:hypothetical protein